MNLMDCVGCGFSFSTERGAPGNYTLCGDGSWYMNHVCDYCKKVTHVGSVVLIKPPEKINRRVVSRR